MENQLAAGLKTNNNLKRNLKIFFAVGCLGFLLVGGLIIWASVATVQHVAGLGADPRVQEQVEKIKTEISGLPALAKGGCWEKVQSLLNVQIWLQKPVAENIASLKDACLAGTPVQ